jgi:hypothetical protein
MSKIEPLPDKIGYFISANQVPTQEKNTKTADGPSPRNNRHTFSSKFADLSMCTKRNSFVCPTQTTIAEKNRRRCRYRDLSEIMTLIMPESPMEWDKYVLNLFNI